MPEKNILPACSKNVELGFVVAAHAFCHRCFSFVIPRQGIIGIFSHNLSHNFKIVTLNNKKRAKDQSSPFCANTEAHNHIFNSASSF